jgi:hypothetical protein
MLRSLNKKAIWHLNRKTEVNGVYLFDLQLICAKHGLETIRPTCDKIRSIYDHWVYKIVGEHDFR